MSCSTCMNLYALNHPLVLIHQQKAENCIVKSQLAHIQLLILPNLQKAVYWKLFSFPYRLVI